jgi:hypothetical protein
VLSPSYLPLCLTDALNGNQKAQNQLHQELQVKKSILISSIEKLLIVLSKKWARWCRTHRRASSFRAKEYSCTIEHKIPKKSASQHFITCLLVMCDNRAGKGGRLHTEKFLKEAGKKQLDLAL